MQKIQVVKNLKNISALSLLTLKSGLVFHPVHTVLKSIEACIKPLYSSSTIENLKVLAFNENKMNLRANN
jgi:hypothetical protein